MTPASDGQLVDAEKLGAILDLPASSIRRLAREGRLAGVYRVGRLLRFNVEEVKAALKAGQEGDGVGRV